MKQVGILTLVSVMATAAAPVIPDRSAGATEVTGKSVEQFGGCFAAAQDRAGLAWAYVPKGDGGTFSNLGAKGARDLYFLAVTDRGRVREIRLETAGRQVARAVDRCI